MRTVGFRLVDLFLLRFHGDGYAGVDVFALKASEFFVYFAPAGAEILSSDYTRPLRSLAQEKVSKEKGTPRHSSALLDKAASQPYPTEPIPCVPRQSGGRAQLGDLRGFAP